MSRVTDPGFPSYTRLYRQFPKGSCQGINTPGQSLEETCMLRVLNSDYATIVDFIIGTIETVGGFSTTMQRRVPLRHPDYPNLLAMSYQSTAVGFIKGATSAANSWKYRDVTITFAPPNYDLDGQKAFITEQTSPTTRAMIVPPSIFLLNGLAPTVDPEFPVPGTNLSLTLHQLTSLPLSTYALYQRRVNNATFYGYGAGELQYMGPSSNRTTKFGATLSYEVTHEFVWSSIPWNYEFAPNGTLYEMTYASGTRRFPLISFDALFA